MIVNFSVDYLLISELEKHAAYNMRRNGDIMKKRVVLALGHRALGTTLPEQKAAIARTAKCIADLIEEGYKVAIKHAI